MTSRELVYRTLEFRNPERVPRDLWVLPWAHLNCEGGVESIMMDFPMDFERVSGGEREMSSSSCAARKICMSIWHCGHLVCWRSLTGCMNSTAGG